jgi:carnosine N-methyltransferase
MLIASHFILNLVKGKDVFVIYPWVLSFNNNMTVEDQLKSCHIPDIDPHDLPPSAEFSMTAGDFNEVYKEPDSWDCVVTCYFIDTSPNVVAYIETIKSVLKPGGYWINFGPLLYHFSDMSNEHSVELSYEMIHRLILDYGFELVKEEARMPSSYIQSPWSMMKLQYECVFFVARKPVGSR